MYISLTSLKTVERQGRSKKGALYLYNETEVDTIGFY